MEKPSHKITIDSSVIIRALSTDRHFMEERRRAGKPDDILIPSAARKAITMACEAKPIWVLHREQITELREVIDGLLSYSQAVANGLRAPDPEKTLLDSAAMLNAVELLDYLNILDSELCTTNRPDVIYGTINHTDSQPAIQLAHLISAEIKLANPKTSKAHPDGRRPNESKSSPSQTEFRDCLFYAFALYQARQAPVTSLVHNDKHFRPIHQCVTEHFRQITPSPDNPTGFNPLQKAPPATSELQALRFNAQKTLWTLFSTLHRKSRIFPILNCVEADKLAARPRSDLQPPASVAKTFKQRFPSLT